MNTKVEHQVLSLMYPHPLKRQDTVEIKTGEIGIVVLGLKTLDGIAVGDTMTDAKIQLLKLLMDLNLLNHLYLQEFIQ